MLADESQAFAQTNQYHPRPEQHGTNGRKQPTDAPGAAVCPLLTVIVCGRRRVVFYVMTPGHTAADKRGFPPSAARGHDQDRNHSPAREPYDVDSLRPQSEDSVAVAGDQTAVGKHRKREDDFGLVSEHHRALPGRCRN